MEMQVIANELRNIVIKRPYSTDQKRLLLALIADLIEHFDDEKFNEILSYIVDWLKETNKC